MLGELEYAYRESCGYLAAITGTNGKTTTTTLLSEIFKNNGKRVHTVGNIGNPYSGEVPGMRPEDVTVCEVSSFQMETAEQFHPNVAAVLNISEDHLNRHGTMEVYISMKKRVFQNCTGNDSVVLNYDDPETRAMADGRKVPGGVVFHPGPGALRRVCAGRRDRLWFRKFRGARVPRTGSEDSRPA